MFCSFKEQWPALKCLLGKPARSLIALLLLSGLILSGHSWQKYKGDGTFIDHGCALTGIRYELFLSSINMSRPNRYEYKMTGLPESQMTVGFYLASLGSTKEDIRIAQPIRCTDSAHSYQRTWTERDR